MAGAAEQIEAHFRQCLGDDVRITINGSAKSLHVTLYQPEKLSDLIVTKAIADLAESAPGIARKIGRVLVSYEVKPAAVQSGQDQTDFPALDQAVLDANFLSIERASRFFSSICPVCGQQALEAQVDAGCVEIQCGQCGGYQMTVAMRRSIGEGQTSRVVLSDSAKASFHCSIPP